MSTLALKEGDTFLEAVGVLLKAYSLNCLTTLYGDIPYREAYQGASNVTPAFDSQEEVYKQVVADIDSAVVRFARKSSSKGKDLDALYAGNIGKWIKFANSLRMRTLLYLASINESYWAEIQMMVDDPVRFPVFGSNSDNATLFTKDIDPYKSYFGNGTPTTKSDFQMRRFTAVSYTHLTLPTTSRV